VNREDTIKKIVAQSRTNLRQERLKRVHRDHLCETYQDRQRRKEQRAPHSGVAQSGGGTGGSGTQEWTDEYSFRFRGPSQDDFFETPRVAAIDINDAVTLSAWVRISTINTGEPGYIIDKVTASNGYGFKWQHTAGGYFEARFYTFDGVINKIIDLESPKGVYVVDTWYHVCATYESVSGIAKLYIDGTEVAAELFPLPNAPIKDANVPLLLGAGVPTPNNEFDGYIDEVSIWNVAFDQDEVNELYNAGAPSDLVTHSQVANGVAWYRMGENATYSTPGVPGGLWTMENAFNPATLLMSQTDPGPAGLTEASRTSIVP